MFLKAKEGREVEYESLYFKTVQWNTVTKENETLTLEKDNAVTKLLTAYMDW